MTVRRAHGNARRGGAVAVVEVLPVDELPAGLPAATRAPQPGRDALGHWLAGDPATRASALAAARAKRGRTTLAHTLGVTSNDDKVWARYLRQAEAFRRAQVRLLAGSVGGGMCGPAPAALVASAALALAASRYAYQQGRPLEGARLAAEVRQHLLGAHELCAREATARAAAEDDDDPLALLDDGPKDRTGTR